MTDDSCSNQNGDNPSNEQPSAASQTQPTTANPKEQAWSKTDESSSSSASGSDTSSDSDSESSSGSGVDTEKEQETMHTRGRALVLKINDMLKPAAPSATAYSLQSAQARRPARERRDESSRDYDE